MQAIEAPRKTASRSTLYRMARELRDRSPRAFEFISVQRKKAGIPAEAVQDMISKLLESRLPLRAVDAAIDAGFEAKFPQKAMPALVYTLTSTGNLARRPDALRRLVRNYFKKTLQGGEFIEPVIRFLLREEILGTHHKKKGREARIGIARRFKP